MSDKQFLKNVAIEVAVKLCAEGTGAQLRSLRAIKLFKTRTQGWRAVIGTQTSRRCTLEIWCDRFLGLRARKIWFGFRTRDARQIRGLEAKGRKNFGPATDIGQDEIDWSPTHQWIRKSAKKRINFDRPILESYRQAPYFYGFYYILSRARGPSVSFRVAAQASRFFGAIVSNADPTGGSQTAEVYSRVENRRVVRTHLARERYPRLAWLAKVRDDFKCNVCDIRFRDVYGELGIEFAEAHHKIALSRLTGPVRNSEEDLLTVCANCHRMLHRMEGKSTDVARLRRIVNSKRDHAGKRRTR